MPEPPWRVVIFSMILPATLGLDALTRAAGHETAALLTPRLRGEAPEDFRERWHDLVTGAPDHLDVCLVPEKSRLPRLLRAYEPDLAVCLGYPWLLPPEVLAIPPLGVLNGHPSPLPRWRGPFPLAWAIREGDPELGMTFHLMDESFDTGPILAQGTAPMPAEYEWDTLQPEIREWEPLDALVGVGLHEQIARVADTRRLVLEVGDGQARGVAAALTSLGYTDVAITSDLTGIERVVEGHGRRGS